jgi:small basic protein
MATPKHSALAPGRDPVAIVEMIVQVVLGGLLVLPIPDQLDGYWSAAVLAIGGVVTAAWVAREKLLPAVVGVIKGIVALVVALGMHLAPSVETGLIAMASAAVAFWLRTQVRAPIDSEGNPVTVDGVVLSSRPA